MVRVVISSCRIRNIRSSSASGWVRRESITCCSRPGSLSATSVIRSRCRRATPEVIAKDRSYGVAGRNRPDAIRRSAASVSTIAWAGSTIGFSGPCTVTR